MKQVALFFLIIMIVVSSSCKFLREKGFIGRRADTMAIWKVKQDSIRVADSIKSVQKRLLDIQNARLDSLKKSDQARREYEAKFKYNIIVGSFITPAYARNFQAEFVKKGYNARLLKLEGTKFEIVSAEAYQTFRSAFNRLKLFQDSVTTDAWIYVAGNK